MDVEFTLDGAKARCAQGLTVAAAMIQLRRRAVRTTAGDGAPRGLFCGMGVCFDCVMQVDGVQGVRTCVTLVRPGMAVVTQRGATALPESP